MKRFKIIETEHTNRKRDKVGWLMENQTEHVCIICGHMKHEGITVVSQFICEDCESEMIHTEAHEARYQFFIHQMRQLYLQSNA